ncbi:MAG TPA: lipase family protein, partial [Acidimicrobiales bacterium]|nr:lipase family protein [Acidimicrobiales bacterium]
YTTTRDEGEPAIASGLVVVPAASSSTPLPVVAWAHGTTGIDRNCAPSVVERTFESGAFFSLDKVLHEGWALVATDYVGLGTKGPHPYLIGQGEARSVLDAVRAARQMPDARLAGETVVWGHSQGGNAALWTGQIAPVYAPDVPLSGVAALAPASDLPALVTTLPKVSIGSLFATYVIQAYADTYPEIQVSEYVRPAARTTFDEAAKRCLDATALASVASSLAVGFEGFDDVSSGPLHERLVQNTPTGPISAPLLLAQGEADGLIVPSAQAAYVQRLCSAGQPVDFRTFPGLDHVPLVEADSPLIPQLLAWTEARFGGEPATPTCGPGAG